MPTPNPLRDAFRQRALGAIERMAREASPESLAAAIARGAEARTRLAERAGGLLSVGQVAALLGITRAAVDKRRSAGKALAVRIRGDWHYPAAQFRDGEVIEGIADILAAMPDTGGWAALDLLLADSAALDGRSPLACLRAGDIAPVLRLLRAREADAYA